MTVLVLITLINLRPITAPFNRLLSETSGTQILDRHGEPLNVSYQTRWNTHDLVALHRIPGFLKTAFILSEDKRFYNHIGFDWVARLHAVIQNVRHLKAVRGASTITEQVVRMIHPRPRTLWSRWLEGWEAMVLEKTSNKDEILEFYLNQVPYAANRRGVVQSARYYFNRDLETLSQKEMLALVVLVRAPSRVDLFKDTSHVQFALSRLTTRLAENGGLNETLQQIILNEQFQLEKTNLSVNARHFVQFVKQQPELAHTRLSKVRTTLDGMLQQRVQRMLDRRVQDLKPKQVHNSAVLIVDHSSGEILSWAVADSQHDITPGKFINAALTPRQPGSALKPFLYTLALQKGWSVATVINDRPLVEPVGTGLHSYQNYSRHFYGPVTLRTALGNSLNIPALKAVQFVGTEDYLNVLKQLGFKGLERHPNFYGDGIALGNGEVTLYELVQAYAVLANKGLFRSLTTLRDRHRTEPSRRVFTKEVTSLIGNVLSDPQARRLEFSENSVLNLPIQTAVKTGTSTDYRDAWAIGYNFRYVVGVWMGNLDQTPTEGVTGSTGPALLLRSLFAELTRYQDTRPLYMSPRLSRLDMCMDSKQIKHKNKNCHSQTEWFILGTEPKTMVGEPQSIRLRMPTPGLQLAYDPRLPESSQALEFHIQGLNQKDRVRWNINGREISLSGGKYLWPIKRGAHRLSAIVWRNDQQFAEIDQISFSVK